MRVLLRTTLVLPLLCITAIAAPQEHAEATPPVVGGASFEEQRARILPSAEELAWKQPGWRASLWEGVIEAQRRERPILLWAMNGHPLGCT